MGEEGGAAEDLLLLEEGERGFLLLIPERPRLRDRMLKPILLAIRRRPLLPTILSGRPSRDLLRSRGRVLLLGPLRRTTTRRSSSTNLPDRCTSPPRPPPPVKPKPPKLIASEVEAEAKSD